MNPPPPGCPPTRLRNVSSWTLPSSNTTPGLKTTQRDDGLWESIEHDDDDDTATPRARPGNNNSNDQQQDTLVGLIMHRSVGTQTSKSPSPNHTTPAAQVGPPTPVVVGHRLRRGRGRGRPPKDKKTNEPSTHRRRVRFTDDHDPSVDPSSDDASARARGQQAAHVFVRLHRVLLLKQQGRPKQQQQQVEFVWNNRAKAWKLSGAADPGNNDNMVELHGLLDQPPERLALVRALVAPTERGGGGTRQPLELAWDPATACFQGGGGGGEKEDNNNRATISVALGEMKDMARDPWRRQYVGYYTL